MRELLNYLGICFPHKWGRWHSYGPEQEYRQCQNCNETEYRNKK